MKKNSTISEKIKALRAKLNRTQEQFAKLVRVERAVISSWETGAKNPSSDSYLEMARLADYPDSLWFLEQAGVIIEDMYRAVSEMNDAGIIAVASSEIVPVRPLDKSQPLIPLPKQFIEKPLSARYLKVDRETAGLVFADQDIVVLDTSVNDVQSLWDKVVLVRFLPLAERPYNNYSRNWPGGLFMGRLRLRKVFAYLKFDFFALLGPLTEDESGPLVIGNWSLPIAADNFDGVGGWRDPKDRERFKKEAELRGPLEIALFPGCQILGRMVAWFSGER